MDILGRLKSYSAIRKALIELPETLDETYERIWLAIPREHRPSARATLSIRAAQNDSSEKPATAQVILRMVLRSLGMPTDSFYDISDIREMCGCLVTFVLNHSVWVNGPSSRDLDGDPRREKAVLAHYTVQEFPYAARIVLKPKSGVSHFALKPGTVFICWADLVIRASLSASPVLQGCSPSLDAMSAEQIEYCLQPGGPIIADLEDLLVDADLTKAWTFWTRCNSSFAISDT